MSNRYTIDYSRFDGIGDTNSDDGSDNDNNQRIPSSNNVQLNSSEEPPPAPPPPPVAAEGGDGGGSEGETGGNNGQEVRTCLGCSRNFSDDFDGLAVCGNPIIFGSFENLMYPDRTCKKISCRPCNHRNDLHEFRFCRCQGDFPLMWCKECRDSFQKCCSCDAFFCLECDDQIETKKYGLLCEQCFELMIDIDEQLKAEYFPPGGKIRLGLDYYPNVGADLPVQKLYAKINGMTEERAQKIKESEEQVKAVWG